jgi:hypothetical protein
LPLKVACAEAALSGLRGLIVGRHEVRTGLLERSRLGSHVTRGRWADAATPDLWAIIPVALFTSNDSGRCAGTATPGVLAPHFTKWALVVG